MTNKTTPKQRMIKALAKFLVENQTQKSIELQMGKASAKEWAELRQNSNLMGYPTVEEAEKTLTELFK